MDVTNLRKIRSPQVGGLLCPEQFGMFAHPSDCTKFVTCNFGSPIIKDCGLGTSFNNIIKNCDYMLNSNCGGSGGSSLVPSYNTPPPYVPPYVPAPIYPPGQPLSGPACDPNSPEC